MASPADSILTACVAQAKSDITLTGEGSAPAIPDAHVVSYLVPYTQDRRERFQIVQPPSLIFTMARSTKTPAAGGDNCRYLTFYTVLAQITHTDLMPQYGDIAKSVQKWEYNIRNYFHMGNLQQAADTANWKITLSPVQEVEIYNEKLFHIFDNAVAVIPIIFKSNEQHNAAGRT